LQHFADDPRKAAAEGGAGIEGTGDGWPTQQQKTDRLILRLQGAKQKETILKTPGAARRRATRRARRDKGCALRVRAKSELMRGQTPQRGGRNGAARDYRKKENKQQTFCQWQSPSVIRRTRFELFKD